MEIEQNVPLAPLTTLGIGGAARYFVRAKTVDEVIEAVDGARARGLPLFVLGGGSNVLISDRGFPGLVLHIALSGVTVESEDEYAMVHVGAGEPWDPFVERAVSNRWAGIECLSGIPGQVGATPIQNVGAYGQEVSETIVRVEVLDTREMIVKTLTNSDCAFAYRSSVFKSERGRELIVLGVTYRLPVGGAASVRYPELRRYLEERGEDAEDLAAVRNAVIAIRRRKGMVLDPGDPDTRSDGSFFMNPVIDASGLDAVRRAAAAVTGDAEMPAFPTGDGRVKLSAAWLIERAGFPKGFTMGNAGISSKHTLAVINRGGASAEEVLALVRTIQQRVREVFGVELHPEPRLVGF
ncbi:MAG TPA: UDP-N-acetylmuramate dehydrogenase [Thermoanaerobaculia bacterium]|nr:UDP-N-acetylmuramate dehydrogenase [Thermoanaerobaculia bacterium]